MAKRPGKIQITAKPELLMVLAAALLIIPIPWIAAWILATLFHEFCHFVAIKLSGCRIFQVQLGLNGAAIDTDLTDDMKEVLCALAGPLGGLLLLLTGRWFPRVALCGLFQSLYNLIPVYPLDGGRAVRGIARKLFSEPKAEQIEKWFENCILLVFLFFGAYSSLCLKLGLMPLLFSIILIVKHKRGKCTCKERSLGVK